MRNFVRIKRYLFVFSQHERELVDDSGSEGWGFESLLACQKSCCPLGGRIFGFAPEGTRTLRGGAAKEGHAGGMSAPRGPQQLCCKDGRREAAASLLACHAKSPLCLLDKAGFLRTKCSALRNVKFALQVKCAARVRCACGTIFGGTLHFSLCVSKTLHDGAAIASLAAERQTSQTAPESLTNRGRRWYHGHRKRALLPAVSPCGST